jgi:hypothetical protein
VIVISRGLARSFRALARKCVNGRPRGPAPAVVFEVKAGTLTAWTRTDHAALVYAAPSRCDDEVVVVPMAVLEAVEGGGGDPVELAVGPKLTGEARWSDRGVPRTHPFDAILPGKQHRPPDPPDDWHQAPPDLLCALHECGRTAAKESGRFALSRVQVRGKAGQVIGTDGKTALVWSRLDLPFTDDLLVPAVPVFGSRELAGDREVRVGRTSTHLVVAAGPWRVYLPVDKAGRYPDVAGVIPKDAQTVAGIDDTDAAALIDAMPDLPGAGDDCRPVTLDLDGGVVVRARDEATGKIDQMRLEGSPSAGPHSRVVIDRRVLARALSLGCVTVRVTPDRPVVFEGHCKTLIAAALDPSLAVEPGEANDVNTADTHTPERRTDVKHETNGHTPNGRHDPPAAEPPDPMAAAEELRTALADATAKATRLVAALKYKKKEQRALTQVWSSLKALNLGPGGQP